MDKIKLINQTLESYFSRNRNQSLVPAKDLMPEFIQAGVFLNDTKSGLPIRNILRKLDKENQLTMIPRAFADRKAANVNWYFTSQQKVQDQKRIINPVQSKKEKSPAKSINDKDETYVLNLCDEVLGVKGLRQHRFSFLLGDKGHRLPVDVYYPEKNLVIEYREYQHTNAVAFFDKPDKLTVSGISRSEQRKLYDQRRRDILPKHGITLIEIDYSDFRYNSRHRIVRDVKQDLEVVATTLKILKKQ
jgi:hypothetical protein